MNLKIDVNISSLHFNMAKWTFLEREVVPLIGHLNQPHRDFMFWYKILLGTNASDSPKGASYRHSDTIWLQALS